MASWRQTGRDASLPKDLASSSGLHFHEQLFLKRSPQNRFSWQYIAEALLNFVSSRSDIPEARNWSREDSALVTFVDLKILGNGKRGTERVGLCQLPTSVPSSSAEKQLQGSQETPTLTIPEMRDCCFSYNLTNYSGFNLLRVY